MTLQRAKNKGPKVPVSAMSDIGFLLLIFIMLVSLINYRQEVKIQYPEAQQALKTSQEHNFEIWIDSQGSLFLSGKNLSLIELEGLIVQSFLDQPDQRIHILSDRNTPYQYVNGVVKVLQLLQHRVVSFVVKEQ